MPANTLTPSLVNVANLARQLAMDILPVSQILQLNSVDDKTWERIQEDRKFQEILHDYAKEWNSASNTRTRIKVKSQSAIEMLLEPLVEAIMDSSIPLSQRIEAIRQLARLGELEGKPEIGGGQAGGGVSITINVGQDKPPVIIDAQPSLEITDA